MAKQVLFRDDFTQPELDLSKWTPNWLGGSPTTITPPVNGQEVSCYDPEQVSIKHNDAQSWLSLEARAGSFVDFHGSRYQYASGCVTSHGKAEFTPPVHATARVWLPGGATIDNWPAFWMDGHNWPQTGEIDIVEGLHGHAAYHLHSGPHPEGVGASAPLKDRPHAHAGSWHHFGVLWTPDRLDFEYDHVPVGSITQDVTDDPMYLILNLALSPSISPPVKAPSEMRVDFVEVVAA